MNELINKILRFLCVTDEFEYSVVECVDGNAEHFYAIKIYHPQHSMWLWVGSDTSEYISKGTKTITYEYYVVNATRFSTRDEALNKAQTIVKEEQRLYNRKQVKILQ